PGRAALRRADREAASPRGVQVGGGVGAGDRGVPGRAERAPEAVPVDGDGRPHPPAGGGGMSTNLQLRTLLLHDTTEFSFSRGTPDGIGRLSFVKGRHVPHTACGVLRHSSLAVTLAGVPLGLAAVKFWTRKQFKGTNALRGKVNATR